MVLCPGCLWRAADRSGACARCLTRASAHPLAGPELVALGRYQGALSALVRAAKYRPSHALLTALGGRLGEVVRTAYDPEPSTVVVWVPTDARRRRGRGTDHARRIAEAVAAATGLLAAPTLVRTRATTPQSRVPARAREGNVRGAIALAPGFAPPRHALLIDDVATSGATLRACRTALGGEVRCAVVAVAAALAPPPLTPPRATRRTTL